MELHNIQNNNYKLYYENLLQITNNLDIENNWIIDLIKKYKNDLSLTETENIESSESKELEFSEDYLYKKTWNKLSYVHKKIKLKEFVYKLPIKYEQDKIELVKTFCKLLKSKQLTKKNQVNYDKINGRVVSIPDLQYKDGKYFIKNNI